MDEEKSESVSIDAFPLMREGERKLSISRDIMTTEMLLDSEFTWEN
jgi:hypothetical protein